MPGTPRGGEIGGDAVADRAARTTLVAVGAPPTYDFAGFGE